MVNDETLINGFQRCKELGALPMVSHFLDFDKLKVDTCRKRRCCGFRSTESL